VDTDRLKAFRWIRRSPHIWLPVILMEVVTNEGEPVGVVKEIIQTGVNDVFVLSNADKGEIFI
jgi:ribosomal 30S subunit maturation factor RimM